MVNTKKQYVNITSKQYERLKIEFIKNHNTKNIENQEKTIKTNMERYGYEFSLQVPEIREKGNITKLERYGHINYRNLEQTKETWVEKYGYDSPNKSPEIKEKISNTCMEKYGVNNYAKTQEFKDFMSIKSKEIQKNTPTFICPKCGRSIKGEGNLNQHLRANKCTIKKINLYWCYIKSYTSDVSGNGTQIASESIRAYMIKMEPRAKPSFNS